MKDKDRMDRAKFKALTFPKKIQWVLQYYGVTALVVVAAVCVGVVFFNAVFGPGEQYDLRVMALDDRLSVEQCQAFADELGELVGGPCDVTSYLESDMSQMQAFVVRLTTDPLDLVIAPEDQMEQLIENGYVAAGLQLQDDSRYMQATWFDNGDQRPRYIGRTAVGLNGENAAAGEEYFTQTAAEQP